MSTWAPLTFASIPEEGVDVLIGWREGHPFHRAPTVASLDGWEWLLDNGEPLGLTGERGPTHWMPLPPSPR